MIAIFIAKKMNAYIAGGMAPETAARFTHGELEAIYKGNHHSRNNAGKMRPTPLPENIDIKTAREKCTAAINEILRTCTDMAKEKETPCAAPESVQKAEKRNGLEGLKKYAKRKPT